MLAMNGTWTLSSGQMEVMSPFRTLINAGYRHA